MFKPRCIQIITSESSANGYTVIRINTLNLVNTYTI